MRIVTAIALTAAVIVTLAGCGSPQTNPAPTDPVTSAASPSDGLLWAYGLDGLSTAQIVERLDQSTDQRPAELRGSVRPTELVLDDGAQQVNLPMPTDEFYLSLAPYREMTHECYFHNVGTCQGELADTAVHVVISDESGQSLVDTDATTYANGFVGFWVPKGSSGTITVSLDGLSASVPFGTGDDDGTCVTTLHLT